MRPRVLPRAWTNLQRSPVPFLMQPALGQTKHLHLHPALQTASKMAQRAVCADQLAPCPAVPLDSTCRWSDGTSAKDAHALLSGPWQSALHCPSRELDANSVA